MAFQITDVPLGVLERLYEHLDDKERANAKMSCKHLNAVRLVRVRVLPSRSMGWWPFTPPPGAFQKMSAGLEAALRGSRGAQELFIEKPVVLLNVGKRAPHLLNQLKTLHVDEIAFLPSALAELALPSLERVVVEGKMHTYSSRYHSSSTPMNWSQEDILREAAVAKDPRVSFRRASINIDEHTTEGHMDYADAFWSAFGGRVLERLGVVLEGTPSAAIMERVAALLERTRAAGLRVDKLSLVNRTQVDRGILARIASTLRDVGASSVSIGGDDAFVAAVPSNVRTVYIRRHERMVQSDGNMFCALERALEGRDASPLHLCINGTLSSPNAANYDALARLMRHVTRFDVGDGDKDDYLPAIVDDDYFFLLEAADVLETLSLANISPSAVIATFDADACRAPALRRVALMVTLFDPDDFKHRGMAMTAMAEALASSLPALKELEVHVWCLPSEEFEPIRQRFADVLGQGVRVTVEAAHGKAPRFFSLPFFDDSVGEFY